MNRSLKVPIVIILILGISAPAALAQNSVYGAAMSWYERGAREGSAKEQFLPPAQLSQAQDLAKSRLAR